LERNYFPFSGNPLGIALILVTIEISHRNIIHFVATQQKYIISAEAALLGVLLTEMLARIASYHLHERANIIFSTRFHIMIRLTGYLIEFISVI
jgi:hypothetical protein